MSYALQNLLEFFGLANAPVNLSEFVPYFFKGMFGIGFFVLLIGLVRYWGGIGKNM